MEDERKSVIYKRNHVTFTCTNDEETRLMKELKATGLVVCIKCDQKSMTDANKSHMINGKQRKQNTITVEITLWQKWPQNPP